MKIITNKRLLEFIMEMPTFGQGGHVLPSTSTPEQSAITSLSNKTTEITNGILARPLTLNNQEHSQNILSTASSPPVSETNASFLGQIKQVSSKAIASATAHFPRATSSVHSSPPEQPLVAPKNNFAKAQVTVPSKKELEMDLTVFVSNYKKEPTFTFNLEINGRTLLLQGICDQNKKAAAVGGFGRVFFGVDPDTGKKIAVKVVQKKPHQTTEDLKKEAGFLLQMQGSEHALGAQEIGFQGNHMFVVMDKVDGTDLLEAVNSQTPPSLEQRLSILLDVAKGLKELHAKGIIHKDLKLENILVDKKTNKAQIIDLGLSASIDEKTTKRSGTVDYMAPEVLLGDEQGPSTDAFALGILILDLLANKSPRLPSNEEERNKELQSRVDNDLIINEQEFTNTGLAPEICSALADFTTSCLTKDPSQRTSIDDIITNLEELLQAVSP